jgi:carboxymethylenebutenolidase
MIEQDLQIQAADGTADAVLFRTEQAKAPGVIFLTDIGGIRAENKGIARRLAEKGFTVLMPNVFYRTGRPPMFTFTPTMGEERTMKRFGELASPMTPERVERDAAAYVDFLASHEAVSAGKLGVVGYCFTGAFAMRTAAVRPDKIAAAASFHGGGLYTETPASPHHALSRIKSRLYFGHAINDQSMPADAIAKLDKALAAWGGKYESETYDGAYHGWTTPGVPAYNEAQANRAFDKLSALFAQTLK